MNAINTVADVQAQPTAALIAFYNEHNAEKQIKKFADRQTAVERCEKLARKIGLPDLSDSQLESVIDAAKNGADEKQAIEEADEPEAPGTNIVNFGGGVMFAQLGGGLTDAQRKAMENMGGGSTRVVDGKIAKEDEPVEKEYSGRAPNSAGVAASWARPDVAAARLTRDGVTVSVDGAPKTEHGSTRNAFRAYRLPDSKHIRFRMRLKASRCETFEFNGKKYEFRIAKVSIDAE